MIAPQTELTGTIGEQEIHRESLPPGEYVIERGADTHIRLDSENVSRRRSLLINHAARLGLLSSALGLASCATSQSTRTDLDEPIFGSSHATTYIISPTGNEPVHARDLAKVARVLRRYKSLTEAERALVKSAVGKRLNALISLEITRVQKEYQPQREAISRLPDKAVAARRLAELEGTIRQEAAARVAKRLGNLVAVPLKTSDNRSAVAFARVGGATIDVAKDAGEIDRPIASLVEGQSVQSEPGRVATVVEAGSVPVARAP